MKEVLLLPPNLVGHLRLCLLAAAAAAGAAGSGPGACAAAAPLLLASIALDALDGWLARRLDQASLQLKVGPDTLWLVSHTPAPLPPLPAPLGTSAGHRVWRRL